MDEPSKVICQRRQQLEISEGREKFALVVEPGAILEEASEPRDRKLSLQQRAPTRTWTSTLLASILRNAPELSALRTSRSCRGWSSTCLWRWQVR